jgi:hypothetical protein
MANIPEGWTDDMTIVMPPGVTVDQIVDMVIKAGRAHVDVEVAESQLIETFGLSSDDAALVRDRVYGGIVRAATRQAANCPDKVKDPFAWTSFQLATNDTTIIRDIYPKYWTEEDERLSQGAGTTSKRWWQFWK